MILNCWVLGFMQTIYMAKSYVNVNDFEQCIKRKSHVSIASSSHYLTADLKLNFLQKKTFIVPCRYPGQRPNLSRRGCKERALASPSDLLYSGELYFRLLIYLACDDLHCLLLMLPTDNKPSQRCIIPFSSASLSAFKSPSLHLLYLISFSLQDHSDKSDDE